MTPAVSVILPVYNARQFLPRCLDSLLKQTFRDFEVIAVDDGSTDGSGALLDTCGFGERLQVVHQKNGGASAARNAALRLARGEYMFMMDADDDISPLLLERSVAAARTQDADFVLFDFEECSSQMDAAGAWTNDALAEPAVRLPCPPLEWFVGENRLPALWQFLWRRSSLDMLTFLEGVMYEDNAYIYSYLTRPVKGVHLPAKLYRYYNISTSVMHVTRVERRIASMDAVLRRLKCDVSGPDYTFLVKRVYAFWIKSVWRDLRRERSREAKTVFCRFLRQALADGVVTWGVFPLRWRIRLLLAIRAYGLR